MKRLSLFLWLTLLVAAELPPLPQARRLELSTHILVARVGRVTRLGPASDTGLPKIVYAADVRVLNVEKGEGVNSGDELRCTYWKAGPRPHGWAGPGGQYVHLQESSVARLYLVKGEQGYRLLNPNGWDETGSARPEE